MSNLTISLDPAIAKAARIRAIQEHTSVSAQVRLFLQRYAAAGSTEPQASLNLPIFDGKTGLKPGIDPRSNKSLRAAAGD